MPNPYERNKERNVFSHYEEILLLWEKLNKKRVFPMRKRKDTGENILKYRNTISFSEADIYVFSLERNKLRNNLQKVKDKYSKMKEKHEESKNKFTNCIISLNKFKEHKNTLIEVKLGLQYV